MVTYAVQCSTPKTLTKIWTIIGIELRTQLRSSIDRNTEEKKINCSQCMPMQVSLVPWLPGECDEQLKYHTTTTQKKQSHNCSLYATIKDNGWRTCGRECPIQNKEDPSIDLSGSKLVHIGITIQIPPLMCSFIHTDTYTDRHMNQLTWILYFLKPHISMKRYGKPDRKKTPSWRMKLPIDASWNSVKLSVKYCKNNKRNNLEKRRSISSEWI